MAALPMASLHRMAGLVQCGRPNAVRQARVLCQSIPNARYLPVLPLPPYFHTFIQAADKAVVEQQADLIASPSPHIFTHTGC